MVLLRKIVLNLLILLFSSSAVLLNAADIVLPPGVTITTPDKIKWEQTASGREQAFLMGNPKKLGPICIS